MHYPFARVLVLTRDLVLAFVGAWCILTVFTLFRVPYQRIDVFLMIFTFALFTDTVQSHGIGWVVFGIIVARFFGPPLTVLVLLYGIVYSAGSFLTQHVITHRSLWSFVLLGMCMTLLYRFAEFVRIVLFDVSTSTSRSIVQLLTDSGWALFMNSLLCATLFFVVSRVRRSKHDHL